MNRKKIPIKTKVVLKNKDFFIVNQDHPYFKKMEEESKLKYGESFFMKDFVNSLAHYEKVTITAINFDSSKDDKVIDKYKYRVREFPGIMFDFCFDLAYKTKKLDKQIEFPFLY